MVFGSFPVVIFSKSENGHLLVLSSSFLCCCEEGCCTEKSLCLLDLGSSANDIHGMSVISWFYNGTNVNDVDGSWENGTPLYFARKQGHTEIVKILFDNGAR